MLNGLGERCGNANLVTLIPTLALKGTVRALRDRRHAGGPARRSPGSRAPSTNSEPRAEPPAPYVGASAFATKAGIHASAVAKDPRTYEHVPPKRRQQARSSRVGSGGPLESLAESIGWASRRIRPIRACSACSTRSKRARRRVSPTRRPTLRSNFWRAACSAACRISSLSRAFMSASSASSSRPASPIRLPGGGQNPHRRGTPISAAEGNGPVNALDLALRKDLGVYQK